MTTFAAMTTSVLYTWLHTMTSLCVTQQAKHIPPTHNCNNCVPFIPGREKADREPLNVLQELCAYLNTHSLQKQPQKHFSTPTNKGVACPRQSKSPSLTPTHFKDIVAPFASPKNYPFYKTSPFRSNTPLRCMQPLSPPDHTHPCGAPLSTTPTPTSQSAKQLHTTQLHTTHCPYAAHNQPQQQPHGRPRNASCETPSTLAHHHHHTGPPHSGIVGANVHAAFFAGRHECRSAPTATMTRYTSASGGLC